MATKKAGGSTRLGRDSHAKRLGVKIHDGEEIKTGMIITRQRGTKINPGKNVGKGKDDTLFALADGKVKFTNKKKKHFDGTLRPATYAHVITA